MVAQPVEWVLLNYRIPRDPSTPRIMVWRKLKRLGVAQLGDGLVALPHDARTREQLEWIAADVRNADGDAIVWIATPAARRHSDDLARQMRADRDREYAALLDDIAEHPVAAARTIGRWRRQWQRIKRRDYFRAPQRAVARLAIDAAARGVRVPTESESEQARR